jgi:hypothetical protein
MRGKRERQRKKNPLVMLLCAVLMVEAVLAGVFFLRPSGKKEAAPATPEMPEFPDMKTEEPAIPQPLEEPFQEAKGEPIEEPAELSAESKAFVISLLGDCTLSSSHYTNHFENTAGDDLAYPFSHVAEILKADDLTLANLECSFSNQRLQSASEFAFCGQPKYAQSLVLGGVDCVTMANNHTHDFGAAGISDTAAVLESVQIPGIQDNKSMCFDLTHTDGSVLRVGVYALPFTGSVDQMKKGTTQLREAGAEIVIACMHAGAEKIYVPTGRQKSLAHAAINGGADVVVGTHPHILQPVEEYQDGLILYSIGNFCFGGNRSPSDPDTVIAQLVAEVEEDGVSWEMQYIPCSVSSVPKTNDYRPTPYEVGSAAYERCLKKLEEPWDKTTAEQAAAAKAAAEVAAQAATG